MGVGRYLESPDKRFTAFASTMSSRSYLAGEREYYEFRVEDGSGRVLRNVHIEPKGEALISWRDDGTIEWSTDGSGAIFFAQDFRLVLITEKKK